MSTKRAVFRQFTVVVALLALAATSGCGKKKEDDGGVPTAPGADVNANGDSDSGAAMGLQTVHFPFDSFALDDANKNLLKSNAEILKSHAGLKIQIEGHCDQRGGIQYNIALGEKRANAGKKFLIDEGIDASRITTISFGKERPIDPGTSEEAYAKNRRDNFAITSK